MGEVERDIVIMSISTRRDLKLKLKELSKKTGKSISQLVTQALEGYISNLNNNWVESKLVLEELKKELQTTAFNEKLARAEARAYKKEAIARKKVLADLTSLIDVIVKDVVKNRKKASKAIDQLRQIKALENYLLQKEKELKEKEQYLKEKEEQLRKLETYLKEKEDKLIKVEQMIRATSLGKNLPTFVLDLLDSNGMQAVSLDEVKEALLYAFTDDEFLTVINQWEIIDENKTSYIRRVNEKLVYHQLKNNPNKGFFKKI